MNKQEIFDTVVAHLRQQNDRSYDPGKMLCLYLSNDGKKCAVGCLLKPEEYHNNCEAHNINWLFENIPSFKKRIGEENEMFLSSLQRIHDDLDCAPNEWEERFRDTAEEYSLTYTPPSA